MKYKNNFLNIDLERKISWVRLEQMQREDTLFYSQVIKENGRGNGLIVKIESLPAFLPNNHLGDNTKREKIIGKSVLLQFLEVKEEINRLIVSNRKALVTLRLKQIKVGDLITGKVIAIREYGLIVNIDNLAVLLHIYEISQVAVERIDLNSIFQVDDEIKAIIIWMDIKKGRVAVSTKELELEPGDMLKNLQLVYENAETMAVRYRKLIISQSH